MLDQSRASGIFLVPRFRGPMAEYLAEVQPETVLSAAAPDAGIYRTEWPVLCDNTVSELGKCYQWRLRQRHVLCDTTSPPAARHPALASTARSLILNTQQRLDQRRSGSCTHPRRRPNGTLLSRPASTAQSTAAASIA